MRTHYDVLGVTASASADEIRAGYRRLVLKYHPDRHQGNPLSDLAAAELAALNQAHEVLGDAGRRAAYDAELAAAGTRGAGARGSGAGAGAAGGTWAGTAEMRRRKSTLALVLRLLSLAVVLLVVVRFVPLLLRAATELWKVLAGSVSALLGGPALIAAVVVAALAVVVVIARWGRRRKGSGPI